MSTTTVPELSEEPLAPDFAEIFREYAPMIYRTARAIIGNAEDAEDVVQGIFLKLMRRDCPRSLQKNPRAYLYRAAVNMSLDRVRASRRRPFTHEVEALKTPAAASRARFDDELHGRLYDALAELNPEAIEILVLRYVHNYSDAQISKLLGTTRGAIAVRLFRLRSRLKKLLRGPLGDKL